MIRCEHQPYPVMACPSGCHDETSFSPRSSFVELICQLAEQWANNGELDAFHAHPNLDGHDGLCERVNEIMEHPSLLDQDDGWCEI